MIDFNSLSLTETEKDRTRVRLVPGEDYDARIFLQKHSETYDAQHALDYILGNSAWEEETRWVEGREQAKGRPGSALIPEDPKTIQDNLHTLMQTLNRLREEISHREMYLTSGLRPPHHNNEIGGAFSSRHQVGLAFDIVIVDKGGREIPPKEVAQQSKNIAGAPRFHKAIYYNTFTHFALHRDNPASYAGQTKIFANEGDSGASPINASYDYEVGEALDDSEREIDLVTGAEFAESQGSLLENLDVRQAEAHAALEEDYESADLGERPVPEEGELDIGDLRFGSIRFNEVDPSDLNQPTAVGQQNAGSVATTSMLRTDMDPVIADNKALPETVITISLNATQRDDVNDVLRPLVAMQRRCPFVAARNRDLARLMLGLGVSGDRETRLRTLYPEMSAADIEEMAENMPQDMADVWVPVTIRQVAVDTQPGAAELYQMHVVLRFANIMPYVPEMKFWEGSEHAVQWARYQSLRSMQGTDAGPKGERLGSRQVITPTDRSIMAEPPADITRGQTDSPYQSYPFRKMYRGLLEEYEPNVSGYHALKRQERFDQLKPLAHDTNGDPIYEPAYPISDPARTFEQYSGDSPIGLQYITVSAGQNPQARLQRILSAFEEQIDFADSLDAAVDIANLGHSEIEGLEEAGKISPWIVGPGQKLGKIMLAINQTTDAFSKVADDMKASLRGGDTAHLMENTIRKYEVDLENGTLQSEIFKTDVPEVGTANTERRKELAGRALPGVNVKSDLARSIMKPVGIFSNGGLVDFQVPDRKHEEVFVPFTKRLEDLQKGILATYVRMLEQMGNAELWSSYAEDDDTVWSAWFDNFIYDEMKRYMEKRGIDIPDDAQRVRTQDPIRQADPYFNTGDASGDRGKLVEYTIYNGGFHNWVPEGFGSYMLTYRFMQRLLEHTKYWELNADVPTEAFDARQDMEQLIDAVHTLSEKSYNSVNAARSSIEGFYQDKAEETYGYLALQNGTIENIRLQFSNNYGDREWDGYPHPVTQHLGGDNAEVTIEMTTNNMLLLDQLGELKRSQQAVSEMRKTQDVVPPLVQVKGPGNILRAHGIRSMAYRSHSINMAQDKPGYYKIRLHFVQDEETLARQEKFRRVGGSKNGQVTSARATAPLSVPFVGGLSHEYAGFQASESEGARPAAIYDFFQTLYQSEVPDADHIRGSFGAETLYERKDNLALFNIVEDRTIQSIDVRYHPPGNHSRTPGETSADDSTFRADVRYRDADNNLRRVKDIDVSPFFGPLAAFLDYAGGNMAEDTYQRLVQRIEASLSTGRYRKGLLLSWVEIAKARLMENDLKEAKRQEQIDLPSAGMAAGAEQAIQARIQERIEQEQSTKLTSVRDNMTEMFLRIAKDEELRENESFVLYMLSSYRLAASEITSAIFSNAETYSTYETWLNKTDDFPGLERGKTDLAAEQAHRAIVEQQTKLPSAYMDLLMPALRDPAQDGVNILAPDFPFGPGSDDLTEDAHYERYELADKMRQVAAVKMATIGFQPFDEYTGDNEEVSSHNMPILRDTFNEAIRDLRLKAQAEGGTADSENSDAGRENLRNAPFDLSGGSGGEPDYFGQVYEKMQKNRAFKQEIDNTIHTEDLVQALRISKTFEYVTAVMEAAAGTRNDAQLMLEDSDRLNPETASMVSDAMESLRNGNGLTIGPASMGDQSKAHQNQTDVQGNPWLIRKRNELISLYQADADVLQDYLGYYDRYTEPRRAKLKRKLRDSWKGWEGMRRAFPSYMLILSGRLGTGLFDVMSDMYSWTAVQQIEIRDMADNAGQQCDLALSNMRKRIVGNPDRYRPTDTFGSPSFDKQMEVKPGNHMHVYTGYGPDVAHMEPFAGRVTAVNPGPVTQVQLSSYSTTMNNQPNSGRGFFVDGWDGQQSIAESILYTISQTTGLEGLGRKAPGAATDRLGRSARGFSDDDYRSSVMVDLYRVFGSPGMAWMMENDDTRQRAGTLLDVVSRYELDKVKEMVLGDPAIYENVWVTASPENAGVTDMLFGGLADYLTGGKGWGWAARPGQTAWSQLKQQALLFPDYVVTTRPYNAHVPLHDLAEHPLRQTLYFGPKTGSYIRSSREPGSTDAFTNLEEEELEKLIAPDSGGSRYDVLWQEYKELYVTQTATRSIIETLQGGEGGDAFGEIGEWLTQGINSMLSGSPTVSNEESGRIFSFLENHGMEGDRLERTERELDQLFPNTTQRLYNDIKVRAPGSAGSLSTNVGTPFSEGASDMTAQEFIDTLALKGTYNIGSNPVDWASTTQSLDLSTSPIIESDPIERSREQNRAERIAVRDYILEAFQKDLLRLAKEPEYYESLGNGAISDNPLIKRIREKLISQGFVPSQRMEPVQKHHFTDTYRHVASQNLMAADTHPAFANRVTLSFPTEPDERLAAYLGQQGDLQSYQVQASPTISEDFIVDDQVYYANLRYNQGDVAGMIAGQLDTVTDDGIHFSALIEERKEVREAISEDQKKFDWNTSLEFDGDSIRDALGGEEDQHPREALKLINRAIQDALSDLQPFYTRPKFSTVAINILKERFKHMYSGELVMAGDPSIRPYHMVHLWDDVDQMMGPAEVQSVYHRFDSQQGFYTQVNPKLATYMRGADEGMDTQWMNMAGRVSSYVSWANRAGSFIGSMGGLGARAVAYKQVANGLKSLGGQLFSSGAKRAGAAMRMAGMKLFAPLAVIDSIRTVGKYLYNTGQDKAASFVGMISGAMDANPIMFLPLSYKGEPYTAGLTGAQGPASLTEVAGSQLDEDGLLQGASVTQVAEKIGRLYDTSQRAPTSI